MAEPASGKLPDPFESVEVDSVKDDPVTAGEMTTLRQTTTTTVQPASKDPFDDDSDFPPELTEKAAKPAPARDPFVETPDPLREAASVAVFEPVKEPAAPALVVPNAALNSELADAEMPLLAEPVTGGLNKRQKHWVDRLSKGFMYVAIVFGVIAGIVAIVLYSIKEVEASTVSVCVAGLCAFTCFALTAIQVALHLSVYSNPAQQRLIVRIILMCPIYAIDSFIGLVAYRYASVVNLVRDSYESYVIYMFFNLLLSYLGGEEAILRNWADSQPTMEHLPPFCFLPHVKLNAKTLNWWKFFLLQYTILNPFFTLLAIPLYFTDNYHEGEFSLASPYAWFSGIKFISVTFAFTSLVYFFFGTKQFYGEGVNPMPKFAAIKAVVFFSFWQTVLLAGLNHFSVVPHSGNWTADEVATGLGNFVLCIEMFIIAVAHRWIFTDKPYHTAEGRQSLRAHHVRHVFAVSDVIKDAKKIVKQLTPMGADEPSAV